MTWEEHVVANQRGPRALAVQKHDKEVQLPALSVAAYVKSKAPLWGIANENLVERFVMVHCEF